MNTKLTLTIEKEVIESAKQYASEKGQSLSDLVENYFKLLTHNMNEQEISWSPKVRSLKGVLKVKEDFDYRKLLEQEISKKHGV